MLVLVVVVDGNDLPSLEDGSSKPTDYRIADSFPEPRTWVCHAHSLTLSRVLKALLPVVG